MPYLLRDAAGRVVGVSEIALADGAEAAEADDPEVVAALLRIGGQADDSFVASDLAFIRVIEDVIEVLVRKRLVTLTELPPVAREKLLGRRLLRGWLSDLAGIAEDGGKVI